MKRHVRMFKLPAKVMPELEVARGSGAGTSHVMPGLRVFEFTAPN